MSNEHEEDYEGESEEPRLGGMPREYWDSDEALANLQMEQSVHPEESDEDLAQRLFKEAAPQAAMALIHLSQHGMNENTRLNASKYITERVLGPVTSDTGTAASPLERLLGDFHKKLEEHANTGDA